MVGTTESPRTSRERTRENLLENFQDSMEGTDMVEILTEKAGKESDVDGI